MCDNFFVYIFYTKGEIHIKNDKQDFTLFISFFRTFLFITDINQLLMLYFHFAVSDDNFLFQLIVINF